MSELITLNYGIRNTLVFIGIVSAIATLVLFLK